MAYVDPTLGLRQSLQGFQGYLDNKKAENTNLKKLTSSQIDNSISSLQRDRTIRDNEIKQNADEAFRYEQLWQQKDIAKEKNKTTKASGKRADRKALIEDSKYAVLATPNVNIDNLYENQRDAFVGSKNLNPNLMTDNGPMPYTQALISGSIPENMNESQYNGLIKHQVDNNTALLNNSNELNSLNSGVNNNMFNRAYMESNNVPKNIIDNAEQSYYDKQSTQDVFTNLGNNISNNIDRGENIKNDYSFVSAKDENVLSNLYQKGFELNSVDTINTASAEMEDNFFMQNGRKPTSTEKGLIRNTINKQVTDYKTATQKNKVLANKASIDANINSNKNQVIADKNKVTSLTKIIDGLVKKETNLQRLLTKEGYNKDLKAKLLDTSDKLEKRKTQLLKLSSVK